jgi:hypothetical protein
MDDEWVTLRRTHLDDARWCKSVLEATGIEAAIPDEFTPALPLVTENDGEEVRVLVRATDIERAIEVLDATDTWTPPE